MRRRNEKLNILFSTSLSFTLDLLPYDSQLRQDIKIESKKYVYKPQRPVTEHTGICASYIRNLNNYAWPFRVDL